MISSTLLTLIVIPAIFGLVKGLRLPSDDHTDLRPPAKTIACTTDLRVLEPAE
jgi:Cu(I)/Ag(I) efflux system membrane protein CusA/SilA